MADLLVLPRLAKNLQNGKASAEKLDHTGPAEKERVPQCHKVSSWQVSQSRLCQKENEQSHLCRSPDCEEGKSPGERGPYLGERERESEREHGKKRVDSTVKEGRFQGGEEGQAKRTSLGEIEGSMSG